MNKTDKILITGASGMVGSALSLILEKNGYNNLLKPTHEELELTDQPSVGDYISHSQPDYVFHLAAVVGGIQANNEYPADFIYKNTLMHSNVIDSSFRSGVKKLLFPGSACTYPKLAEQPIPESEFLNGEIEPTNIAYAAAKINGIVMCQSYTKQYGFNIVIPMPTNTYGVGDNFNPKQSHVIPALMDRLVKARDANDKKVEIWGTGEPLREFIYVDDLANALVFLMKSYDSNEIINIGTMDEISIKDLASKIAQTVGYQGELEFDTRKPDGAPRKCLDSEKLKDLGWKPSVSLYEGLKRMYEHHYKN